MSARCDGDGAAWFRALFCLNMRKDEKLTCETGLYGMVVALLMLTRASAVTC